MSTNIRAGDQDDKEFERRIKLANTLLKEREIAVKEQTNGQPS